MSGLGRQHHHLQRDMLVSAELQSCRLYREIADTGWRSHLPPPQSPACLSSHSNDSGHTTLSGADLLIPTVQCVTINNVHLSLESQTCECNEGQGWTALYQTISTSTQLHTASLNTLLMSLLIREGFKNSCSVSQWIFPLSGWMGYRQSTKENYVL